jgi:hypothetical protein
VDTSFSVQRLEFSVRRLEFGVGDPEIDVSLIFYVMIFYLHGRAWEGRSEVFGRFNASPEQLEVSRKKIQKKLPSPLTAPSERRTPNAER